MRSLSFDPQLLRQHLLRHKIATLPELKQVLGTSANLTVFRKLKLLDYLSSYTHRGRYYALRETARFDEAGLWLGIPTMANAIPERNRTAFRDGSEHLSERSDADSSIFRQVFGIVKSLSGAKRRKETVGAGIGVGGRGRRLRPLPFSAQDPRARV